MPDTIAMLDNAVIRAVEGDVGASMLPILLLSLRGEIEAADAAMARYLASGEIRLLCNQAHALKSASRSFGMLQLGDACLKIELATKATTAKADMQHLLVSFQQVARMSLERLEQDWPQT